MTHAWLQVRAIAVYTAHVPLGSALAFPNLDSRVLVAVSASVFVVEVVVLECFA